MERGLSTIEYLMTYGWTLIVIVLVVVALSVLGVFNLTPPGCRLQTLNVEDHALYEDGNFSINLQNTTRKDITITGIEIESTALASGKILVTDLDHLVPAGSYSGVLTVSDTAATRLEGGTNYISDITIEYTSYDIVHTDSGNCSGQIVKKLG